jgi:hypothetical protein
MPVLMQREGDKGCLFSCRERVMQMPVLMQREGDMGCLFSCRERVMQMCVFVHANVLLPFSSWCQPRHQDISFQALNQLFYRAHRIFIIT